MQRLTDLDSARDFVWSQRSKGKTVGVVPTMGALHEGHLSLVRLSKKRCDFTVATIFVNPTQFAANEDLGTYPRTLQQDCEGLAAAGADAVFLPSEPMMYPQGFSTYVQPPDVAKTLEGRFRPSHFRGVTTVVLKLLNILPASHAIFGRKDYQQLQVIEAMVRDLNLGIKILGGDIVREPDGLALSSRNRYLSESERRRALKLSESLQRAKDLIADGESDAQKLKSAMRDTLIGGKQGEGVDQIDYAVLVDQKTLQPVESLSGPTMALIAAHVGNTRLIDNAQVWPAS